MLEKTIKRVLGQKIKAWAKSVKDENVKQAILNDTLITGGAIVSLINNEIPNDYDVYFKNFKSLKLVTEYYINQFNKDRNAVKATIKIFPNSTTDCLTDCLTCTYELSCKCEKRLIADISQTGEEYNHLAKNDNERYKPRYITTNAITLSDSIQFVLRFYGSAKTIHKNYDFVHCTGVYESDSNTLSIPSKVYECIINKVLRYQGSLYPFCSIVRMRKFIERGYSIGAGEIAKMCIQLSEINLKNIDVLEEQLTGVDTLLFQAIINKFKKKIKTDSINEINTQLMCDIIDEFFIEDELERIRSKSNNDH